MRSAISVLAGAALVALASTGSANAFLWKKMPAGCTLVPTGLSDPVMTYSCPGVFLSSWNVDAVRGGGGPSIIRAPQSEDHCYFPSWIIDRFQ